MPKYIVFVCACLIFFSHTAYAQSESDEDDDARESLYLQWEETLKFGIEDDVLVSVDNMIEEEDDVFATQVLELFFSTRSPLRTKALDYFEAFERNDLISSVLSELNFYQDQPSPEFTIRLIRHLEHREYNIDDELWEVLGEMLQEEGRDVRLAVINYLGDTGYKPSALLLGELYEDADLPLQEAILRSLGKIKDEKSRELIFALARDTSSNLGLRIAAIHSTAAYGSAEALELLSQSVVSPDPLLRTATVAALANFSSMEVQSLYLEALRDAFWRVRLTALQGIEKQPFPDALPALKYMSREDPERNIKQQTLKSIAAIASSEAWAYLREILHDSKQAIPLRQSAASLLVQKNFEESRGVIEATMVAEWEEKNSRLLDTICKGLSTRQLSSANALYERMLGHGNFIIQIYGVRGVGLNKIQSLKGRLIAITEDKTSHPSLKNNAQTALDKF